MATATVPDLVGEPSMQEVEKLFREHYQLIYRTAYAITGRAEDAEDVLQTVFSGLFDGEPHLTFSRTPKAIVSAPSAHRWIP
jgi:DNA-directed RNA polymerase specialized sigma24 family protein